MRGCLPMHPRAPNPKGKLAKGCTLGVEPLTHRSGSNSVGWSTNCGLLPVAMLLSCTWVCKAKQNNALVNETLQSASWKTALTPAGTLYPLSTVSSCSILAVPGITGYILWVEQRSRVAQCAIQHFSIQLMLACLGICSPLYVSPCS